MNLRVFERMLQANRHNGKICYMFVGIKELAIPICRLAKKFDFPLEGVIPINQTQILPEDYSGVPIIDLNRPSIDPRTCAVIIAIPGQAVQTLYQQFASRGFGVVFSLLQDEIDDIFSTLQFENLLFDKIRAELRRNPYERILLFNQGVHIRQIKNTLLMSGISIDDVIQSLDQLTMNSLVIFPIENAQQKFLSMSSDSGKILPLYAGELLAAEQYWNAHQMFYNYFDLDNVPDFVAKFEKQIKRVLNVYDEVNISVLNVENEDAVIEACALSLIVVDKKILHVMIPINQQGNQVNYAAAADNVLLKKVRAHLQVLTLESREFWRYFIKKQPTFVSYSRNVPEYYAARYRNETLKIDPMAVEISDEERKQFCRQRSAKYSELDEMIVSDKAADCRMAMLLGVPIVLVNIPTFTLDDKLIVRSDKTPMLMLPKKFLHAPSNSLIPLPVILNFEEQMADFNARMKFFNQNGVKLIECTPEEIRAAIAEMKSRGLQDNKTSVHRTEQIVIKMLERSKNTRQRDVFDGMIASDFLKNNQPMLGAIYVQRESVTLQKILPSEELSTLKAKFASKIKVRTFSEKHWNTIQTFCEECRRDTDIDLLLLAHNEVNRDLRVDDGYKCLLAKDYDVESDKPDIFVLPYVPWQWNRDVGDIRKHSRLLILLSRALVVYGGLRTFIDQVNTFWLPNRPDYYIMESYLYNQLKDVNYFKQLSLINMGMPKYDPIYNACRDIKFVEGWEKLADKKVILWATSHGIYENPGNIGSSFPDYAETIFKYVSSHLNVAMIFRPHFLLLEEMTQRFGIWSNEEMNTLRDYCAESPNIVFDEANGYEKAIAMADVIITDPHCGIITSTLPTLKPICVLVNQHNSTYKEDALNHCYKVRTAEELTEFFAMIERGDDPMYSIREEAARKYVKHFDGKNGWRIKEFIKQKFREKFNPQEGEIHS